MTEPAEPTDAVVIDAHGDEVEHAPTTAALVAVQQVSALTRPVAKYDDVLVAFEEYQRLRAAIILDSDMQGVSGKSFVKKSGWRKMAVAMGVSAELRERDYDRDGESKIVRAEVIVRAVAPNGRFMDGLGVCDVFERCDTVCMMGPSKERVPCTGFRHFSKPQHDIPATAYTRALNRACSDLFGFGEVSYEEVQGETGNEPAEGFATHADARLRYDEILEAIKTLDGYRARADGGPVEASNAATFAEFFRTGGYAIPYTLAECDAIEAELRRLGGTFTDPAAPPVEQAPKSRSAQPEAAATPEQASGESPGSESGSATGDGPEGNDGLVGSAGTSDPSPSTQTPAETPTPKAALPQPHATADEPSAPASTPPRDAGPTAPPEPSKPSTAQQRQRIGARCADLAGKGLLQQGDKPELVGILTNDRTATTTEITEAEASKLLSALAYIESGHLAMETDGEGVRNLASKSEVGDAFLKPIVGAPA